MYSAAPMIKAGVSRTNQLKIRKFFLRSLADTNTNTNTPKSITSKVKKLASRVGLAL